MRKERPEVKVGDIWRDRDPRSWSGNRRVKVVRIEDGRVFYRQTVGNTNYITEQEYSSKFDRFQRAFDLI